MKRTSVFALFIALGLLTGCGSSSSAPTVVFDSGTASGNTQVAVDETTGETSQEVTVTATDTVSGRDTAAATVPAGTVISDAAGNAITEDITIGITASTAKVDDGDIPTNPGQQVTGTAITISGLSVSGSIVDTMSQPIPVTVKAPQLASDAFQVVTSAWLVIKPKTDSVALAPSLRAEVDCTPRTERLDFDPATSSVTFTEDFELIQICDTSVGWVTEPITPPTGGEG